MAFTPYFGTGFEMGSCQIPISGGVIFVDGDQWGGSWGVTNGRPHSGNFSANGPSDAGMGFSLPAMGLSNCSDIYFGLWFWPFHANGGGYGSRHRIVLTDGKIIEFRLVNNLYHLYIDNVLKQDGHIVWSTQQWHNAQMHVIVGDSGLCELLVDGGLDISYSGDTQPGATNVISYCSCHQFGANAGATAFLDDVVIGTGGWPGDIRFEAMVPQADATPHQWMTNGISMQDTPVSAPTVEIGAGAGLTGTYHYKVTMVDPFGETLASPASDAITPVNQNVHLSNLPTGLSDWTTSRKIYRTAAGGSIYKLCGTVADGTTTTYDDNLADGSLGANEPVSIGWDKLDERGVNDNDYIVTRVNGQQDLHTLSDWAEDAKKPLFLVQWSHAKKGTADLQQFKMLIKSGATISATNALNLLTSYQYFWRLLLTDPNGNIPWTHQALEDLQSGVESVIP